MSFLTRSKPLTLKKAFTISLLCLLFLGHSSLASTGTDGKDNKDKKEKTVEPKDGEKQPEQEKKPESEKPKEELKKQPKDSTSNSLNKLNFVFYFVYKYKYQAAETIKKLFE